MNIQTVSIDHVYPTEVWFEKDVTGAVHVKMQHMTPDTKPFTFITINYNYAYTSNSHQHDLVKKIGKLLGQDDIQQRNWVLPDSWKVSSANARENWECYCYNCNKDITDGFGLPRVASRMIVCPTCGNKRCPHATDHNLACTGSNEPGQPGSRY